MSLNGGTAIRGVVGRIEWSYFVAAAVNGYRVTRTLTRQGPQWAVRGLVINADSFKLRQRPLFFVAPHAHGQWRWQIRQLDIDPSGKLTAELDPPVE